MPIRRRSNHHQYFHQQRLIKLAKHKGQSCLIREKESLAIRANPDTIKSHNKRALSKFAPNTIKLKSKFSLVPVAATITIAITIVIVVMMISCSIFSYRTEPPRFANGRRYGHFERPLRVASSVNGNTNIQSTGSSSSNNNSLEGPISSVLLDSNEVDDDDEGIDDESVSEILSGVDSSQPLFDDNDNDDDDLDNEKLFHSSEDFYKTSKPAATTATLIKMDSIEPDLIRDGAIDNRTLNENRYHDYADAENEDFDDHEAFNTSKFYSTQQQQQQQQRHSRSHNGASRLVPSSNRTHRRPINERDQYETSESFDAENSFAQQQQNKAVECALVLERGLCITFAMVEWALRAARRALKFRRPSRSSLNTEEPSESTINSVGELVEMTTRILANRLQLNWLEVTNELERIDMRQTSLWEVCPLLYRTAPSCLLASRYRTHSGRCNNIQQLASVTINGASSSIYNSGNQRNHFISGANFGSANMPFERMLPADYGDGIGLPRRSSSSGSQLPPARLVSLELHPDMGNPSTSSSALFMSWGQLINHDLALASGARDATGHGSSCCAGSGDDDDDDDSGYRARRQQHVCMPILISASDPVYAPYGVRCHEFKRSLSGLRLGCSLGERTQLNTITSFVDANFVYGSSRTASGSLRHHRRGLLEMWNYFGSTSSSVGLDQRSTNNGLNVGPTVPTLAGLKPLLPPQVEQPDQECLGRRGGRFCFRSGDSRTNQQVQLVVLHTLHTRQHNRLARALGSLNPHWTDSRLYHEARHIHIAMVQHILITEYLPKLLGPSQCEFYKLQEAPLGSYWDHYNPMINPSISQEFAAAAFRQGHSTVSSQVFRFNLMHQLTRFYQLRQLFLQPWSLYEPGAMDEFLLGLVDAPAQSFDPFVSSELTGHLLQEPGEPVGLDLIAINIQRGRDQGVAGYNAFREWCGLERVQSFEELTAFMSNRSVYSMAHLYETVDDIDLFSGGISEFPLEGAQLGPTFACIVGRQFSILRSGDRYWFETSMGPQAFTLAQLDSIKQLAHPILNQRLPCEALPELDISLWFESPPQSQPAGA